jgi:hypothetical protein
MTIDKLLDCSADELEAMKVEQYTEYFSKYLNVTRPELAVKPGASSGSSIRRMPSTKAHMTSEKQAKLAKIRAAAQQLGIDLDI